MAETLTHWPLRLRLHGILCNRAHRRHDPKVTNDIAEVTCSMCLGLLAEQTLEVAGKVKQFAGTDIAPDTQ